MGVCNVKVRIISALVGIVVLVGIMAVPSPVVLVVACALLAAVAVFELLHNTGILKQKSLVFLSMGFAALEIPLCCYIKEFLAQPPSLNGNPYFWVGYLPLMLLGIYVVCLLVYVVLPCCKVTFEAAQYAFLLSLYAAVGFGSIAMLRLVSGIGWWLVVLLLVIAWSNDTGAYFVGVLLGKHKMAPKISPKKSWEGFFGGWVISVLCAVLVFILRFEIQHTYGENIFYTLYLLIPVAFLLAPLSVCGDLLASVIKRKCGIKDYGNIMPGHGGVMDRFDSVILIAPLLYLFVVNYSKIYHFIATLVSHS